MKYRMVLTATIWSSLCGLAYAQVSQPPAIDPTVLTKKSESQRLFQSAQDPLLKKNWNLAIDCLEKSVACDETNQEAQYQLSQCYQAKNNRDKAISHFRKSIFYRQNDSENLVSYEKRTNRLVEYLFLIGNSHLEETVLVYNLIATQINRSLPTIRFPEKTTAAVQSAFAAKCVRALALVALSLSQWDKDGYETTLGKAIQMVPDLALARFYLGEKREKDRRFQEALEAYRKASLLDRGQTRESAQAAIRKLSVPHAVTP